MLEVDKRKNQCDLDEFGIKTDQGEFSVSREQNNGLYIGFILKDPNIDAPMEFKITKENYTLYRIFYNLYNKARKMGPYDKYFESTKSVTLVSDDFNKIEEASTLTIKENEETDDLSLIFRKSKSTKYANTYFVRFADYSFIEFPDYKLFDEFFEELESYPTEHRQIDFEELLYKQRKLQNQGIQRKRNKYGVVNK